MLCPKIDLDLVISATTFDVEPFKHRVTRALHFVPVQVDAVSSIIVIKCGLQVLHTSTERCFHRREAHPDFVARAISHQLETHLDFATPTKRLTPVQADAVPPTIILDIGTSLVLRSSWCALHYLLQEGDPDMVSCAAAIDLESPSVPGPWGIALSGAPNTHCYLCHQSEELRG